MCVRVCGGGQMQPAHCNQRTIQLEQTVWNLLARFVRKALIPVSHPCEEGSCGPFVVEAVFFGTNFLLNLSSTCSFTKRQQFSGAALVLLSFSFFGTLSKGLTFSFPRHYCFLSTPQGPKQLACGLLLSAFQESEEAMMVRSTAP